MQIWWKVSSLNVVYEHTQWIVFEFKRNKMMKKKFQLSLLFTTEMKKNKNKIKSLSTMARIKVKMKELFSTVEWIKKNWFFKKCESYLPFFLRWYLDNPSSLHDCCHSKWMGSQLSFYRQQWLEIEELSKCFHGMVNLQGCP